MKQIKNVQCEIILKLNLILKNGSSISNKQFLITHGPQTSQITSTTQRLRVLIPTYLKIHISLLTLLKLNYILSVSEGGWFQGTQQIPKSAEAQVPYIKRFRTMQSTLHIHRFPNTN